MKKTFVIPLIATGTFIFGMICLFLPFLPFGWLLLIMTALLLTPYFKPVEKLLKWLIKKDRTGTFESARAKVARLYHWAGDTRRAQAMDNFHRECLEEIQHEKNPVGNSECEKEKEDA